MRERLRDRARVAHRRRRELELVLGAPLRRDAALVRGDGVGHRRRPVGAVGGGRGLGRRRVGGQQRVMAERVVPEVI